MAEGRSGLALVDDEEARFAAALHKSYERSDPATEKAIAQLSAQVAAAGRKHDTLVRSIEKSLTMLTKTMESKQASDSTAEKKLEALVSQRLDDVLERIGQLESSATATDPSVLPTIEATLTRLTEQLSDTDTKTAKAIDSLEDSLKALSDRQARSEERAEDAIARIEDAVGRLDQKVDAVESGKTESMQALEKALTELETTVKTAQESQGKAIESLRERLFDTSSAMEDIRKRLNNTVTPKDVEELEHRLDAKLKDTQSALNAAAKEEIAQRIEAAEARSAKAVDGLEERIEAMDGRLDRIEVGHNSRVLDEVTELRERMETSNAELRDSLQATDGHLQSSEKRSRGLFRSINDSLQDVKERLDRLEGGAPKSGTDKGTQPPRPNADKPRQDTAADKPFLAQDVQDQPRVRIAEPEDGPRLAVFSRARFQATGTAGGAEAARQADFEDHAFDALYDDDEALDLGTDAAEAAIFPPADKTAPQSPGFASSLKARTDQAWTAVQSPGNRFLLLAVPCVIACAGLVFYAVSGDPLSPLTRTATPQTANERQGGVDDAPTSLPRPALTQPRPPNTDRASAASAAAGLPVNTPTGAPAAGEDTGGVPQTAAGARVDIAAADETADIAAYLKAADLLQEGRPGQAAALLEGAAANGLAAAQYRLANLYETGRGVPTDLDTAFTFYAQAAQGGNRKAMHNLALFYAEGRGTETNFEAAADWFESAALLGLTDSQFNLAVLLERGLGRSQDLEQALFWYAVATARGDAEAASRRDDVAAQLPESDVAAIRARAENWQPEAMDPAANGDFADQGSSQALISRAQELLNALGFDAGTPDGVPGPQTRRAVRQFEAEQGLTESGVITPDLVRALENRAS